MKTTRGYGLVNLEAEPWETLVWCGESTAIKLTICLVILSPVSGGSMNPARTLGPAIASAHYKGIWVYLIGPVVGTLLGAWSYNLIRVTDKPVQAISPRSFSFKLRRIRSKDMEAHNNDPLDVLWSCLPLQYHRIERIMLFFTCNILGQSLLIACTELLSVNMVST